MEGRFIFLEFVVELGILWGCSCVVCVREVKFFYYLEKGDDFLNVVFVADKGVF